MDLRAGFRLGQWTVLPLEGRLVHGEDSRRVQPKSMDVLLCLAEAGGEAVERAELLEKVWEGRAVTDEPLTRCIGELRRALGDARASPEFIMTIPKRGYRLLQAAAPLPMDDERAARPDATAARRKSVPALILDKLRKPSVALGLLVIAVLFEVGIENYREHAEHRATDASPAAHLQARSLAVLPFVDMSADQDQEFMGDGIAEELLNLLVQFSDLRVISRSSSFSLKGKPVDMRTVAEQFGVAYILEGSVRTSGGRIRITAQLIDGRTDSHVWSETYERPLEDVFKIQDEIAHAVVTKLQVTLLGKVPTSRQTDPEAYALFLQGRYLHEQPVGDSMQRAFDLYKAALEIDPDYVPAWVWLAALYDDTVNSSGLPRDEVGRLARDAIGRALEIDPANPLALGMSAVLIEAWDSDLPLAAARMQQAIDLDPGNPILLRWAAILLTGLGRHEDAVRLNEYLFERDPIGNISKINLAATYLNAGRYDDAVRVCEIEVALSTDDSPCGSRLIMAYLFAGDSDAALVHLEQVRNSRVFTRLAPMVFHALGRTADYERALAQLVASFEAGDVGLAYWIAHTHAFRGDADAMFAWLDRAKAANALPLPAGTAYFARFEDDPRWQRLMASMGRSATQLRAIRLEPPLLNRGP